MPRTARKDPSNQPRPILRKYAFTTWHQPISENGDRDSIAHPEMGRLYIPTRPTRKRCRYIAGCRPVPSSAIRHHKRSATTTIDRDYWQLLNPVHPPYSSRSQEGIGWERAGRTGISRRKDRNDSYCRAAVKGNSVKLSQ